MWQDEKPSMVWIMAWCQTGTLHYSDVIMGVIVSQITSLTIVYSTVYSDADQRKHQSSGSLAFVWGFHRGPVNSPHKGPVTRKMFPFDDVIMGDPVQQYISAELGGDELTHFSSIVLSFMRHHQMKTFSALLALCEGNTFTSGFPSQRPVTRSFYVFFGQPMNKRLSKQSKHWWVETQSH